MSLKDEINSAVRAHSMWKIALKLAIRTGKLDIPISTLKADNECEFGKWLYGTKTASQLVNSTHYHDILKLHAAFHAKAATVGQLAISGKKAEAENMIGRDGEFAKAASDLTQAMMKWVKAEE